jgi:hypothetical protein
MTRRVAHWLENEYDPRYPYPVVVSNAELAEAQKLREWLRAHAGSENKDWAWTHGWWGDTLHCFRFRDQDTATFFRLTWQCYNVY